MNTTPISLLQRLQKPNERASWSRFVELYTPLMLYWSRRIGLQESDAADLVQDVFVTVVQKIGHFNYDQDKSFRGWLRTILINKWRDQLRRRGALPLQPEQTSLDDVPQPTNGSATDEVEYREHLVARALQLMRTDFQPTTWKACWEHIVCGRSAAEVATELGIREGTVYSASCRVIQRLRQELDGLLE